MRTMKMTHPLFLILTFITLCMTHATFPISRERNIHPVVKAEMRPTCPSALSECVAKLDSGDVDQCETLPIPSRSLLKPIAPGAFELTELRKHVWLYSDGAYLSLIIFRSKRLVLIDFPAVSTSDTDSGSRTLLTDAIDQVLGMTVPTRVDMVYSHAHLDHIGAARRVFDYAVDKFPDAKIVVWGTQESKDLVVTHTTNRAVPVTRLVNESGRTIKLSRNLQVKLDIIGGHTQEDLVIYIPRTRGEKGIVHYVDVVFPRWTIPFNLAITQDVGRMIPAQRKLLKLDFDILVPGHLRLGTKKDVRVNIKYLEDLLAVTKKISENTSFEQLFEAGFGNVADPSKREFGNAFYGFFLSRKIQTDACYRTLIERWGCTLAGLDLFLRGHCLVGLMYHLVDA